MTEEELTKAYNASNKLWQAVKAGDQNALFALRLAHIYTLRFAGHWRDDEQGRAAWSEFAQAAQRLAYKCGNHSPEDYVIGGVIDGMRRAIEKGELHERKT